MENLILNGLRHTRTVVRVKVEALNATLKISVSDDGPGIADADKERIFEPFVRLDESRNRDLGGYGLGLAIVKQIVTAHRGDIWVENNAEDRGAGFVITLPAIPPIKRTQ